MSSREPYPYDNAHRHDSTAAPGCSPRPRAPPAATRGYDGDLTRASYDPLGRLVATTNPVSGTTLYTYTATTLAQVRDPAGHVTSFGADGADRRDPGRLTCHRVSHSSTGIQLEAA